MYVESLTECGNLTSGFVFQLCFGVLQKRPLHGLDNLPMLQTLVGFFVDKNNYRQL